MVSQSAFQRTETIFFDATVELLLSLGRASPVYYEVVHSSFGLETVGVGEVTEVHRMPKFVKDGIYFPPLTITEKGFSQSYPGDRNRAPAIRISCRVASRGSSLKEAFI